MRLKQTHCTNCGGMLDLQVADSCTQVFCPYCGQKYAVDQHRKEIIVTETININNRFTNDAEVIRAKTKDRSSRLKWILILAVIAVFIVSNAISSNARRVEKADDISAGNYSDYDDMQYSTAEATLRALGFQNIAVIDLDDTDVYYWYDEGAVDSIVIDGQRYFHDSDTFDPSTQIIIKHH